MEITEVTERAPALINSLTEIWESSVRATHLFLSDAEIRRIREYVPPALKGVPRLIIAGSFSHTAAFMGVCGERLEMLFISPDERGKGLGKRLIRYGIDNLGIREVTVNEQNPQAVGFYEHMGFATYKLTELDEEGNPYPLLYMRLPD